MQYRFTRKKIWETEPARPLMVIKPPFAMLEDLSGLTDATELKQVLGNLKAVRKGSLKKFSFGASDSVILTCSRARTRIEYEFGAKDIEIQTDEILELLQAWSLFLKTLSKEK